MRNLGSSIIEITLLIPIFIGCIYFFIILLLFFVHQAKMTGDLVASLYQEEEEINASDWEELYKSGNALCVKAVLSENGMEVLSYKGNDKIVR